MPEFKFITECHFTDLVKDVNFAEANYRDSEGFNALHSYVEALHEFSAKLIMH